MTQIAASTAATTAARTPARIVLGQLVREGAGVRNVVAIGGSELPDLDPFLLLAEFGGEDPADYRGGFPDHPHRGFETLTYVSAGRLRHADSRGNAGKLGPGSVQRMKAARGLLHAEMPDQETGPLRAFQIWINLPAANKMDEPHYQDVPADRIPAHQGDKFEVRVLVGGAYGLASPIPGGVTDLSFLDFRLAPGANVELPTTQGHAVFAYIYEGSVRFGGQEVRANTGVLLSAGDYAAFRAEGAARLLLLSAKPIGEPVVRRGPFVMNTDAEIRQAFADYQAGRFA